MFTIKNYIHYLQRFCCFHRHYWQLAVVTPSLMYGFVQTHQQIIGSFADFCYIIWLFWIKYVFLNCRIMGQSIKLLLWWSLLYFNNVSCLISLTFFILGWLYISTKKQFHFRPIFSGSVGNSPRATKLWRNFECFLCIFENALFILKKKKINRATGGFLFYFFTGQHLC